MKTQFDIAVVDQNLVSEFQKEFELPAFLATTMAAHGISSVERARTFLSPSLERDWINPYEIPGFGEVIDRLEVAVKEDEHVLVFGDFDLDGISATTVLTRGLRELGVRVTPFIPKRFEEGYGLSAKSIERACAEKPDLIVTVDCGISCKNEVPLVQSAGVDLVITDHHEAGELTPVGIPVADPKVDATCPSSILAGVGVALKVVQALGARFGQPNLWLEYTDFATLGTVADLMPLRDENRALVADGVRRMNECPRSCIAALIAACGAADKPISSTSLSFSLIPRLNAAGRMGNADLALNLLLTDDFAEAVKLAHELEEVNNTRRAIEADLAEVAKAQAEEIYHGQRALVVAGENWHEGVKGIVASRLVNAYGVPSLLFTIDGDEARGSGRSVGTVNLYKAVESVSDILTRFGGHGAAVGVTLPADKLDEFTDRLCAYMDSLPEDSFHPSLHIDAVVDLSELTLENVEKMELLAPFGQENLQPVYLARSVRLNNCRAVGVNKNHLSCCITDGLASVSSIMFHCDTIGRLMKCGSVLDTAFEVQVDEWRGRRSVKAMMKAASPFSTCPAMSACLPGDDVEFIKQLCYEEDEGTPCEPCINPAFKVRSGVFYDKDGEVIAGKRLRAYWMKQAQEHPEELHDRLVEAFIGDHQLHDSQRQALNLLKNGKNVLAVMGTGRGKSLIFHVYAAYMALAQGKASLFVYPLRALITDQTYHIKQALSDFGLTVCALTGETPHEQRVEAYEKLKAGDLDIVLTTPEYLSFHVDDLAASGRIGFLVADEVHHMAQRGANKRPAYAEFGGFVARLGHPHVLALTATAPSQIVAGVDECLELDENVFDDFCRTNLELDDHRSLRDKDSYLSSIIGTGEKTVVYVNSRGGAVELVRELRYMVPHVAPQIGFYHAGLDHEERNRIEQLFRDDVLQVLVCTSAFGEGVNIPNIRHVVLYHMPFSEVEFNQMSGRAGRDGETATIHMVFGRRDAGMNEQILRSFVPDHDTMAQIYRELRAAQREAANNNQTDREGFFAFTTEDLATRCQARMTASAVDVDMCVHARNVFVELGLVEVSPDGERVHVPEKRQKVELTDSVLYREGLGEMNAFLHFRDWVLSTNKRTLHNCVTRPMLPQKRVQKGGEHD